MALVRYEPWNLFERIQDELNRAGLLAQDTVEGYNSHVVTSAWRPAVDIREEPNQFVILADLPGVDPKDIEITMDKGVLTIKGERVIGMEETREGYRRVERLHGTFYRRFSLPDTADADHIEARGRNGVLEIILPKHAEVQPRKISVKS